MLWHLATHRVSLTDISHMSSEGAQSLIIAYLNSSPTPAADTTRLSWRCLRGNLLRVSSREVSPPSRYRSGCGGCRRGAAEAVAEGGLDRNGFRLENFFHRSRGLG